MMKYLRIGICGAVLAGMVSLGVTNPASAQQPGPAPVTRTPLLARTLPPGNFHDVQAAVVELAPGASASRHRHDVAVLAYVLEGTVENQFDGGATMTHKAGDTWWEAPGTVHDLARNTSKSERARLLIVYIGEEGKAATVPVKETNDAR